MPRFDLQRAEVTVLTFKEGLLSAMGHDLKLRATRGFVSVEGDAVDVEVQVDGLEVVGAMKDGKDLPDGLPSFAFAEIRKNLQKDVLEAKRFPTVHFRGTASATQVQGSLTLHGVTRNVSAARHDDATHASAEFQLDQRDFGITPFSGMLGALKVKPSIVVRARVPLTPS